MAKTILTLFAAMLIATASVLAQRDVVDRIVVIVGDRVVLASELANQIRWASFQREREPRTERELMEFQDEVVEQMVSDQLFLIAAQKDTSIAARDDEIESALDDRIAQVAENFGSHDEFLAGLQAEGLTLRDLRKRFRSEVENQILKQRFIQKKLATVNISRKEVEEFFDKFRDSIPNQPEAVSLAHTLLTIQASSAVEDSVAALAEELRQRVTAGEDFATISETYSSMGAGVNGGDLGFISRDDVVSEFARAAFNLRVGDVSGPVRTPFGYHVIKCEGVRGEELRLRHILLEIIPSGEDSARVATLADSLLQAARDGDSFEEIAKVFSADNDTRAQGGELGWFATDRMPAEFAAAIVGWQTPGEYRGPIYSQFGLHLVKLLEYQPEKAYTLEDDFDHLRELARQDKTGLLVDEWIEEIKEDIYIEYRLDPDAN